MISFTEYFNTMNELEYLYNKCDNIEDFLSEVDSSGIGIGAVTTGDIAINTIPLGYMRRKNPIRYDELKHNKDAQTFIKDNAEKFKSIYRKNADTVLYSVAEHLFLK